MTGGIKKGKDKNQNKKIKKKIFYLFNLKNSNFIEEISILENFT